MTALLLPYESITFDLIRVRAQDNGLRSPHSAWRTLTEQDQGDDGVEVNLRYSSLYS